MANIVSADWLGRPAPEVAPDLIGCTLVRQFTDGSCLRGRIVETEAYAPGDPAFHAYRGRTPRNQILFGSPGHVYVYFIYGMYHCCNIVTDQAEVPSAVLIRALELETPIPVKDVNLKQHNQRAAGPGKLCRELQIDLSHNGLKLQPGQPLWLEPRHPDWERENHPHQITQSTRIGLTKGVDIPWRWYLTNSPAVSRTFQKPKK